MTRTVLRGAVNGDVAMADGRIVAVGEVVAEPEDRVIDVAGDLLTPGLVNTHHHLYQWMTRGRAVGCDLFGWLVELYPVWGRIDAEDVRAAALVGMGELALSGCTTVFDHHYVVPRGDDSVFDAIVDAAKEVGVRLVLSRGSMDLSEADGGLPPSSVVEDIDAILSSTERVVDAHHDGDMVSVVVAPCSPFSVSPRLMTESAELARRRGLRLHTHLAETLDEDEHCLARFGMRPLDLLESWGWLHDDVWFAHGIHFNDEEVVRLGAAGTGVAHCPTSNGRLGAGMCRVTDLTAAGAPVGLGVDGAASNESGRLQPELLSSLVVARLRTGDPASFMPGDALDLATLGGAACLGRSDLGRLEVGAAADVAVWSLDDLRGIPDPVHALVLGGARPVRHLFVAGREVVVDGALHGPDHQRSHSVLARRAAALHTSASGNPGRR